MPKWELNVYLNEFKAMKVKEGFNYNSFDNSEWETIETLKSKIVENIDSEFNSEL